MKKTNKTKKYDGHLTLQETFLVKSEKIKKIITVFKNLKTPVYIYKS